MSVTEFSCAAIRPGTDPWDTTAACRRKRWHAGNHRSEVDGKLIEWSDPFRRDNQGRFTPPLPEAALLRPFPRADEADRLDPVTYPGEPDRRAWEPAGWPPAVAWAVFLMLASLWPAVLIVAWRMAF